MAKVFIDGDERADLDAYADQLTREAARLQAYRQELRRVAEEQAAQGSHLRFTYDPRAGEVRAGVVEGGELPARVRKALAERGGGGAAA